ncbi:MAG: SdpI family protein [Acidobacteria bacterium]|nr:SdpI family protein [Acidobacteriota bacterium]MYB31148.1 SdpI family protein [Acidobacteriota bacterium]MYH21979.1 SdpI family protein [Acidobacteriota bacterium]MYK79622.1 SdpI family protein [Acidobacteriota bacterium]
MTDHVLAYVLPAFLLVVSTLMILGKIPPNRIVGFRTEDTLSDPEIWYPVNRAMGWFLAPAAALSLAFNLSLGWIFPDWPQDRIASWTTGGTLIPLVIALVLSIRHYLRPPSV